MMQYNTIIEERAVTQPNNKQPYYSTVVRARVPYCTCTYSTTYSYYSIKKQRFRVKKLSCDDWVNESAPDSDVHVAPRVALSYEATIPLEYVLEYSVSLLLLAARVVLVAVVLVAPVEL
jgi:hypothetical protein